jgi:magnesium-transporting ATPase (P-type)
MISLCHTILIIKKDDDITYNASSPDELALVNFSSYLGTKYKGKDENEIITIE